MGDLLLFTGQIQQREEKRKDDSNGKAPPPPPPHQKCPRCWSTNTKFCYYNNYSISQPRYFCKDCKRYWTLGGSLRDIPLGGYVRKDKRSKKATGTPDDNNTQETRPQQPIILETRTAAMPAASARNIETSMLSNPGFLPTGPASSFYIPSATIRAPFYQPIPVGSQALFMDNQDQVIGMQQTEVQPSNNMPPPCQRLYQSSVISSLNPASSFPKASGFGLPPL